MSARIGVMALPLALVSIVIVPLFAIAQGVTLAQCQKIGPNYRPATANDAAVKNGQIPEGSCYDPNTVGISQEAEEAKQYLKTILCRPDGDNYGGMGPDETINKLDPKFAVCAANFLRAVSPQIPGQIPMRSGAGSVCIREGARTVEKQNSYVQRGVIACRHGASCEHPRGVAIDVNVANDDGYRRLHQLGPQYKVDFYLGFKDRYHFIAQRGSDCSTPGYVPTGVGVAAAPTHTFADQLRQALGMPQQPMPFPQAPQQPLSQQQSPLGAFNQAPQPTLQPVSGTLGTSPLPTPVKSVSDQLMDIINGTTSVSYSTTTATTAPIVITKNNAGTIVSVTYSSSSQQYGSGSLQPVGQTTFNAGSPSAEPHAQSSPVTQRLIQLYTALRDVLIRILDIVRPFGGSRASSLYGN